jgi:hypothetical protein
VEDKADSVALHRVVEPTLSVTVPVGVEEIVPPVALLTVTV